MELEKFLAASAGIICDSKHLEFHGSLRDSRDPVPYLSNRPRVLRRPFGPDRAVPAVSATIPGHSLAGQAPHPRPASSLEERRSTNPEGPARRSPPPARRLGGSRSAAATLRPDCL